MKSRKVRAFTLIELIVAMIITSIVVVLSYNIYIFTEKSLARIKQHQEKVAGICTLSNVIKEDCEHTQTISYSGLVLKCESSEFKVQYFLDRDKIHRTTAMRTDVFPFSAEIKNMYFAGKPVDNGYVDRFSILVYFVQDPIEFVFCKRYDTSTLLNIGIIKQDL